MDSMRFKSYTWKFNPSKCIYSCSKSVIKHKYPELIGVELEDLNTDGAVISGMGEFFGEDAYEQWNELLAVFKESGPGEFYNPIFKDVTKAILQKLEATVEPRDNYVSYTFEFWEHIPPVVAVQTLQSKLSSSISTKSLGTLKNGNTGDWVVQIQKKLIADGIQLPKYGADGVYGSETENGIRKYQKKYKLGVDGICGPNTLTKMGIMYYGGAGVIANKKPNSNSSQKNTKSGTPYVMRAGDTIESVASRSGIQWRDLAKHNNIRDVNSVKVGDTIYIPPTSTPTMPKNKQDLLYNY